MLGDYHDGLSDRLIDAAMDAASRVAMPAFEVRFDVAMSFHTRKHRAPFVLRQTENAVGFLDLHRLLGEGMRRAGLGGWVRSHLIPHMTLLYDRRVVDVRVVDEIRWTVRDFSLVHSLLGRQQHLHIGRWSLQP